MTRLISNLPETTNGLDAISADITAAPRTERIVVAIVDCPHARDDYENNRKIPYMRIRAIEPLDGSQATKARKLLEDAYARRTGQDSLTLEQAISGDTEGKPCPVWWSEGDNSEPCVYEAGHGGLHKLRSGHTWAGDTPTEGDDTDD